MTNIKSNQIKSNRYFYIVALSLIACLIFTACNSKPTQVSSFVQELPSDATNSTVNPPTDSQTETTYGLALTFSDVRSYLEGQNIDLSKVSTNTSNQENLNTIWKTLVNAGGEKSGVKKLRVITGSKYAYFEFDKDADLIYYNDNDDKSASGRLNKSNPKNASIKKFIKAVVIKIDDANTPYDKTANGSYTIGAVYQITKFMATNTGVSFISGGYKLGAQRTENAYEIMYLNFGRSGLSAYSSDTFNRSNYDSATWGYDLYYNPTGNYDNNTHLSPDEINTTFKSKFNGLRRESDEFNPQTYFKRQ